MSYYKPEEWTQALEACRAATRACDWPLAYILEALNGSKRLPCFEIDTIFRVARALGLDKRVRLNWTGHHTDRLNFWEWTACIDACTTASVAVLEDGNILWARVRRFGGFMEGALNNTPVSFPMNAADLIVLTEGHVGRDGTIEHLERRWARWLVDQERVQRLADPEHDAVVKAATCRCRDVP